MYIFATCCDIYTLYTTSPYDHIDGWRQGFQAFIIATANVTTADTAAAAASTTAVASAAVAIAAAPSAA